MGYNPRQSPVIRDAKERNFMSEPIFATVSKIALQGAVEMSDAAIKRDFHDVVTLAELLLHAFYLHESGKYEASHITAWTIAERCLHELWKTHLCELDNQHTIAGSEENFINSERKQRLTGNNFTASIISEFLSLSDILPFDRYQLTLRVRQTRNNWLHKLDTIGRKDAAEAIVLAQFLLRETGVFNVEIPFNAIDRIPIEWVSE
jgi:hypothetical protein